MNQFKINSLLTATALSLVTICASHASAERAQEYPQLERGAQEQSVSVNYVSSALATEAGREDLYARIKRAAKQVCGPSSPREAGSLRLASRNRQCYEEAVQTALSQVESAQLASLAN